MDILQGDSNIGPVINFYFQSKNKNEYDLILIRNSQQQKGKEGKTILYVIFAKSCCEICKNIRCSNDG